MLDWQELEEKCHACQGCGLWETRHNVVFGVGKKDADIMFVGEGPGEQEDLQGVPFVGPAGQLLDEMLSIIDIDRTNCYIANIVNHFCAHFANFNILIFYHFFIILLFCNHFLFYTFNNLS